jgi:hypothetical protein
MEPRIRPLVASLHAIPEPRYPRGRRHPLAAILALLCVAMRCGFRSDSAMADWGRCYGQGASATGQATRDANRPRRGDRRDARSRMPCRGYGSNADARPSRRRCYGRVPHAEPTRPLTSTAPAHQGAAPGSSVDMRRRMQ